MDTSDISKIPFAIKCEDKCQFNLDHIHPIEHNKYCKNCDQCINDKFNEYCIKCNKTKYITNDHTTFIYCHACRMKHPSRYQCNVCLSCFLYDGSKHCVQHNRCHNVYHNYRTCNMCSKCYYSLNHLSKCYNCEYDSSKVKSSNEYYKSKLSKCEYCDEEFKGCYERIKHWFCQFNINRLK
jgi:hypothetical protein